MKNTMNATTHRDSAALYLEYVNNYLTLARFAEAQGMTEAEAGQAILDGRKINDLKAVNADLFAALKGAAESLEWALMAYPDISPKSSFGDSLADALSAIAKARANA